MVDVCFMTDKERLDELWILFNRAYDILETFSKDKYELLNNSTSHSPAKCIKWGLQGISELKCDNYYKNFI